MDVRIGVVRTPKELEIELAEDTDRKALKAQVEEKLATEDGVLWLTDRRGREVAVPASKIAYIEIGSPSEERKVGFGVS